MSAAPTQADLLVDIAETRYECWRTPQGEPYVIDREGPSVAVMLRGRGGSLRAELARAFADLYGKVPSSSALTDALTVLHGRCLHAKVQPVHLRLAAAGAGVVVDLGHEDGEVVDITDSGWELVGRCEGIVFRRTEATAPLPFPARGGDLATLRDLLNVSDESWPLLAAWLVAALLPGIPHPVLLLRGEQGTGKSTAARLLGSLVDPSTAPLRTPPANVTDWAVAAAGSWLVALDSTTCCPTRCARR